MPRFDPEELLRLIEKHQITHLQTVPTMFVRLLKLPEDVRNKYDVSSLEFVVHAAAPCSPEVKEATHEREVTPRELQIPHEGPWKLLLSPSLSDFDGLLTIAD